MESGNAAIDADHRRLFADVNEIRASIEKGDFAVCGELVDQFVVAAEEHFNREEELLRGAQFPNLGGHMAYHRSLLATARKLRQTCALEGDSQRATECYTEIIAFLLDDVVRGDHEFKSHLQEGGSVKSEC